MYATVNDLVDRFGSDELQSVAPGDTPGGFDTEKLDAALEDATSEINSWLGQRYTVPLTDAPNIIKSACCDIARHRLYDEQTTETIKMRYQERITWLKELAKGFATLGIAEKAQSASGLNMASLRTAQDRLLTRDTLKRF